MTTKSDIIDTPLFSIDPSFSMIEFFYPTTSSAPIIITSSPTSSFSSTSFSNVFTHNYIHPTSTLYRWAIIGTKIVQQAALFSLHRVSYDNSAVSSPYTSDDLYSSIRNGIPSSAIREFAFYYLSLTTITFYRYIDY